MKYDPNTVKAWAGNSQWRACCADLARFRAHGYSGWGSEGFWALAVFRLQKVLRARRPEWLWAPLRPVLNVVAKLLKMVTNIELDPGAEIGPGLLIPHRGPIHVNGETKIGADCSIYHVCTIGAGPRPGGATIGDHVYVGCHSSIIGAVTIGDGAIIAANSLVVSDVPARHTAVGVPARMHPPV
jgi:serine O-acetyltransferase